MSEWVYHNDVDMFIDLAGNETLATAKEIYIIINPKDDSPPFCLSISAEDWSKFLLTNMEVSASVYEIKGEAA